MKVTKIKIKNLFGITETDLDGKSVEVTGSNGTGKTSIIDGIKYALTNRSDRDYIIKTGENEGEILIETDSGLAIKRKKRSNKIDYRSVRDKDGEISSPETMLKSLLTPLQLDPVEFIQMSKEEQNRIILDLIEFNWDINWIKEQFGEIPPDVDYSQNILKVLSDIQADEGFYFQKRQDINRDIRNNNAFIKKITSDVPEGYQAKKWEEYSLSEKYEEFDKIRNSNNLIERAKAFKESYDNKLRGLEADRDIKIVAEEKAIANERESLKSTIERLKAEVRAAEEKVNGLDSRLEDKKEVIKAKHNEAVANLKSALGKADEYLDQEIVDTTDLADEINTAEAMKKHLNEYNRMLNLEKDVEALSEQSKVLTYKIELARTLPGEILKTAKIPVEGLTVEDGIPLINGLPVTNLSEGEKLELCVDVALSKPNAMQIILIDGAEKLSDENRAKLYKKCKDKGLQFIATRTTNNNELEINYL